MNKIKLTVAQDKRRHEIASKLWELRHEEEKLHSEIRDMGLRYDIMGSLTVEIEVI